MPSKVTVNPPSQADEAPSETLIKAAKAEIVITDPRGRKITLRRPGPLAQFRLVEAAGPRRAQNSTLMYMALQQMFVAAIDGSPVFFPSNWDEMEVLIQQLDEDGMAAVAAGVEQHFSGNDPEVTKQKLGE